MSFLLLPEWLPVEKWQAWKRMRLRLEKVKKVPFTEDCERIAINRLGRYHAEGYDVGHVLEESTFKGWAGLFVDERTPRRRLPAQTTSPERAQEIENMIEFQRKKARG